MIDWHDAKKEKPKDIEGLQESKHILIWDTCLGDEEPVVGKYENGKYVYWLGEWCNTDSDKRGFDSQSIISHWAYINPPINKK